MSSPFSSRERSPWPLTAWVMLALTILAGAVGITGRVLSPVLVLDVVSLWPLSLPALISAAWLVIRRRRVRPRARALPPLFLLSWLLVAGGLHLGGWVPMPSSSVDLEGPASAAAGRVDLAIRLEVGSLRVEPGATALYAVRVLRSGGAAPAPEVVEAVDGEALRVVVTERAPDDWFRFGGWELSLSEDVEWTLTLDGSDVEADLDGLELASVELRGRGKVRLGDVTELATARVTGAYDLEVPADVAVRVVGVAAVPAGWQVGEDGSSAPVAGEAWVIEVADEATVAIAAR